MPVAEATVSTAASDVACIDIITNRPSARRSLKNTSEMRKKN